MIINQFFKWLQSTFLFDSLNYNQLSIFLYTFIITLIIHLKMINLVSQIHFHYFPVLNLSYVWKCIDKDFWTIYDILFIFYKF